MKTTASLPPGRLRAFLEQRILWNGHYMCRLTAMQLQAQQAKRWDALGEIVDAAHMPIEDDVTWSPPPDEDVDLDIIQCDMFERHRNAEALLGLNRM